MVYERTGYAPWSLTREAGVQSATVDGTIQVPQYVYPNLDTGFLDEKGNWKGRKSSDEVFTIDAPHVGVPNGAAVLSPQTADRDFIDMTGYSDLFIAIRPTQGGNYAIAAVMGPDTNTFANLTPLNSGSLLRGGTDPRANDMDTLFSDAAESCTGNVWNIFYLENNLKNQKVLQFSITNNSGGSSDIDFAFMRMV
jgi:hypothetical protein|tara:strand:+ start:865 stop:1449 length:585 start_codon:yes stop_codon:yes gene_type:complete